jgi:hypothetical protein
MRSYCTASVNFYRTLMPELKSNHNRFLSSILKYRTIREIWMLPPLTSWMCFTMFRQIYSMSEERIGDEIESI